MQEVRKIYDVEVWQDVLAVLRMRCLRLWHAQRRSAGKRKRDQILPSKAVRPRARGTRAEIRHLPPAPLLQPGLIFHIAPPRADPRSVKGSIAPAVRKLCRISTAVPLVVHFWKRFPT